MQIFAKVLALGTVKDVQRPKFHPVSLNVAHDCVCVLQRRAVVRQSSLSSWFRMKAFFAGLSACILKKK